MLNWLKRLFGLKGRQVRAPSSRYDSSRLGPENREHWKGADSLSPNAAANVNDRKILRERARYEVANNSFAFGAANSLAEDTIGTGPRLQLIGLPEEQAKAIEDSYRAWQDETGQADALRLLYRSQTVDGEGVGLAIDNPALDHPVKLDFRVFECDRLTDPLALPTTPTRIDGIEFDSAGNPLRYTVLRQHPGDAFILPTADFDVYPASQVYHLFRADRPGQARGVSWLTPALPLFAQLRRYTLAVLTAAETAANIAGILKTSAPAPTDDGDEVKIETMEQIPIPRGALLTAPEGWDVTQLRAEQPTQSFADFRTQILMEIGRVLDMPLNRITGNSSGYNYSSGRLDHLGYERGIWQQRERLRLLVLDRLFRAWLDEAALIPGVLPDGLPPFGEWAWDWQWDAPGSIDPLKDAQAAREQLDLGLTDLAEQCAARGRRWDEVMRQRAREQELADELGLRPALMGASTSGVQSDPIDPANPDQQDPGAGAQRTAAVQGGVQATALNGAQVTSFVLICDRVATGSFPADAAEDMVREAFPLMNRIAVRRIMKSLERKAASRPAQAPEPQPPAPARGPAQTLDLVEVNGVA